MPNVFAVSDLHGGLPVCNAESGDILLIVGDICPDFRPYGKHHHWGMGVDTSGTQQGNWLDKEFRGWLQAIVKRGVEVVAVWGNHDYVGEKKFLVPDLPWTLLQDSEVTVQGLRIWGTPWVPRLQRWAFYGDDVALEARADMIPEGIDVLMTHGPPWEAGDFVPTNRKQVEKYGNMYGEHVGETYIRNAVARAKPRVTVCGHIHEDRGAHDVEGNPVYNVSAVDGQYVPYDNPFVKLYELD